MNNDNNDISNCPEVGTIEDFIECVNKEFEPNEKTHGVLAQLIAGADNSVADDLTPHELRTMAECFYYAKYIIKEEDPQKAFYWYSKAAQGGDTRAIHAVGTMYANGDGVEADIDKAKVYFEKAAHAGESEAMVDLGRYYLNNNDDELALYWIRKSAFEHNDSDAKNLLGDFYRNGDCGLEQDLQKAIALYEDAAEQDNYLAVINLIMVYCKKLKDYEAAMDWAEVFESYGDLTYLVPDDILDNIKKHIAILRELIGRESETN